MPWEDISQEANKTNPKVDLHVNFNLTKKNHLPSSLCLLTTIK